ncbi:hypothetical protein GCM10011321_14400 [Youhaiella tibetensis]|nr:hypothetical protein GCM10011321_14400 [Youhaiella tibetensis]
MFLDGRLRIWGLPIRSFPYTGRNHAPNVDLVLEVLETALSIAAPAQTAQPPCHVAQSIGKPLWISVCNRKSAGVRSGCSPCNNSGLRTARVRLRDRWHEGRVQSKVRARV